MSNIEKMWNEFKLIPFPSNIAGNYANEIDPVKLDSTVASCINSYVGNGNALDKNQKEKLNKCRIELQKLNPSLVGDAQVYFGKLYRLCDLVIRQT